jgi:rubrerythrin
MSEGPLTASAIISFSTDLEARSAGFYRQLAGRFPEHKDTFAGWAEECEKSSTQVTRTYQETITDALEAGFSFAGLSLSAYKVDLELPAGIGLDQALEKAVALEEQAIAFYQDVAERSDSLLATIPRAFRRVARTRHRRLEKLETLG